MNYEEQLEKQNEELKERLARCEEQLAHYWHRENSEVGTTKLVYKDFNGQMSMHILDNRVLRDNPELLVWEFKKMVDQLEWRTRMRPLLWTPISVSPITIAAI